MNLCFFGTILGIGRNEEQDYRVAQICQRALAACELLSHPRSSTLDLELPMDGDEIASTKNESMKVHVVFIDNGVSDAFAVQRVDNGNGDGDDVDVMEDESGCENGLEAKANAGKSGPDFSSVSGFDLLAGTVKGEHHFSVLRHLVVILWYYLATSEHFKIIT